MRKLLKYPLFLPTILIASAMLLRAFLAVQGWTATNSDEAIMNLAALHISEGRDFPVFFYGQHYLGALEAYLGALLFRLFGSSVLIMRFEMVGFYAAFLAALYSFTQWLYSRNFALVVLALFVLGSPRVLALQGDAVGYPELPLLAVLPFLVGYGLIIHAEYSLLKRIALYALWGLLAGVALWVHILTGPYMLMAFSLMLLWHFREILKVGLWAIIVGFVVGAFPLIWYNLHAKFGFGQDTLTDVLQMTEVSQAAVYNFWAHMLNTLFVSIPLMTGFSSQCLMQGISANYPFLPSSHMYCLTEQALWSFGYVVLMVTAIAMAIIRSLRFGRDRPEMIKESTRLFLLLAVVLTLVLYICGGPSAGDTSSASRYLICTWVSLPAILWPVWQFPWRSTKLAAFALIFIVLVHSIVMTFADMPNAQAGDRRVSTLASYLEQQHITRFYSEYWTCNRLIFYSQERLICGNTDVTPSGKLVHGLDRYFTYRLEVEAAKDPAFVYPSSNIMVSVVENDLKKNDVNYTVYKIAGDTVIIPRGSVEIA